MHNYGLAKNKIIATFTENFSDFTSTFNNYGIKISVGNDLIHEEFPDFDGVGNLTEETLLEEERFSQPALNMSSEQNLRGQVKCCSHLLTQVCLVDADRTLIPCAFYHKIRLSIMGKCSALWNSSLKSESAETIMKVLGCQLTLPSASRWNSLHESLWDLLMKLDKLNETMNQLGLPVFSEIEFEFMEEYVNIFHPITRALDRLQNDKDCFYGCLLPTLLAVHKKLNALVTKPLKHCQDLLIAVSNGFKEQFSSYLELDQSSETKAAILATISNPRFKMKWITINSVLNTSQVKNRVQELLVNAVKDNMKPNWPPERFQHTDSALDACSDDFSGSGNAFNCTQKSLVNGEAGSSQNCSSLRFQRVCNPPDRSSDDFFDYDLEAVTRNCSQDSAELEVLQYLADESSSVKLLEKFTGIKRVFVKFNTALHSSAPVECLLSLAAIHNAPKTNRLSDQLLSYFSFLKGNSNFF